MRYRNNEYTRRKTLSVNSFKRIGYVSERAQFLSLLEADSFVVCLNLNQCLDL